MSSLKPTQTSSENVSARENGNASEKSDQLVLNSKSHPDTKTPKLADNNNQLTPNAIVFCRQRMLYARPHLGSKGKINFGLPNRESCRRQGLVTDKSDALSRSPSSSCLQQTVHVMKYIFPRQFGLHNVFTTQSNYRENPLSRNYSSREEEITAKERLETRNRQHASGNDAAAEPQKTSKVPKRLRGTALELVRQLQNRNRRCCYKELLRYYCPEEVGGLSWTRTVAYDAAF